MPGQTCTVVTVTVRCFAVLQWRAGQLPGQTLFTLHERQKGRELQWRAGQLPGQTRSVSFIGEPSVLLQWRAGQLPGQTPTRRRTSTSGSSFNGGPGNCPAKRPPLVIDSAELASASMEGRAIARPNV